MKLHDSGYVLLVLSVVFIVENQEALILKVGVGR